MSLRLDDDVRHTVTMLRERAAQHPVHRRDELLALDMADSLQSAMLRRDVLTRLRHGVYALTDLVRSAQPVERHRLDLAAAVAIARQPVWAFGASAALLHGMPLPFTVPSHIHLARSSGRDERALVRPSRHRIAVPEARVTTGRVDPASCCVVHAIPVVDVALTAVSFAATLDSARWRVALMDAALWRGATQDDLLREIECWRHLGGREGLLVAVERARVGAQTVLETFSRLALMEQGLPEPVLQQAFHDDRGLIGYVDMWWPTLNVVGEADGAIKYQSREDLIKEKVREDRLRGRGLGVVRWSLAEIDSDSARVAEQIRRISRIVRHP